MYHHVKKLMCTVRVDDAEPRLGNMLLKQVGGAKRRARRGDAVFHPGPELQRSGAQGPFTAALESLNKLGFRSDRYRRRLDWSISSSMTRPARARRRH